MAWIGGLKVCQYEADGIAAFVSNSPFMSFLYNNSSKTTVNAKGQTVKEYKVHMNKEGEVKPDNIKWHQENGTYVFAIGLGLAICTIGTLVLLGIWCPRLGMLGGLLTFGMSIVTLSFLITTPECWVPNLADGATYPTKPSLFHRRTRLPASFRCRTSGYQRHYYECRWTPCGCRSRSSLHGTARCLSMAQKLH